MWTVYTLLAICLSTLLPGIETLPRISIGGWFITSRQKCQQRCEFKHGYFENEEGKLKPVSVGKIYLKVKCACWVFKGFSELIAKKFGAKAAKKYSQRHFFGRGTSARKNFASKIQFVPFGETDQFYKDREEKAAREKAGLEREAKEAKEAEEKKVALGTRSL